MKYIMKKIFLILGLLLSLTSCNDNNSIGAIGDFSKSLISLIQSQKEIDSTLTYEKMNSNDLYKIINKDASYIQNNNSYRISGKVKSFDTILLSIGIYDFIPFLKIDEKNNMFEVDEEEVEKQKEIFEYNLEHIIEELHLMNSKIKIYLLSPITFYDFESPEQKLLSSFLFNLSQTVAEIDDFEYVEVIETFKIDNELELFEQILERI